MILSSPPKPLERGVAGLISTGRVSVINADSAEGLGDKLLTMRRRHPDTL